MLEPQTCANTGYMVEREPRFEVDFNVSVLSSNDESTPSETTLDDCCESIEGHVQDIIGDSFESRDLPFRFDCIRNIEHNSSPISTGYTISKFEGIVGSIMSSTIAPLNVEMVTNASHVVSFRGDSPHIRTLHGTETR